MAIPRFFCPTPLAANTTLELPDALAHHAIRVLRLKPDSDIVLFDGKGGQYSAKLIIDGKRGHAALGEHDPVETELDGRITLVQGIPSGDKMDWIIEKAVELGAVRVVPIAARRSVLQLTGDRLRKRLEHWRRIAQAASEQSGRNRIMDIAEPCSLDHYLARDMTDAAATLFCHPDSPCSLAQALQAQQTELALLVGPEGGWSDEEQDLVARCKLTGVSFGKRVLRTETAGLALIAAVSALQGWS
ncbi:16S rRNA (uracil(1498)-N(3))-methyltransferase [Pollutimonas sp. M17]|uniref:16S rRNA (uracil(1498)-N(3))-methyltransferase n=1 Tax=Pollutimonas sp. M17 TaxID=2962065 RepID=UPI0021F3F051|nr:16S rRNA (uracil(1498)-N(3))-methyltransferase [Pollutimonas sp. M17]UYO92942.1 16S rRNA (uracil(1498)-N(3))-methyltransferase [Pollutimonas sp. M17]